MEEECKHCGRRIIQINPGDEYWVHQPAGSAFLDNTYIWCKLKSAEPK